MIVLLMSRGVFPHNMSIEFNVIIFFCVLDFLVFSSDCSPGPGYKIDPRITRAGVDGTPSYSMLGRQRDQRKYIYNIKGAFRVIEAIKWFTWEMNPAFAEERIFKLQSRGYLCKHLSVYIIL